jgi:flagellar motor switch/type III secretory pathway protein FliN
MFGLRRVLVAGLICAGSVLVMGAGSAHAARLEGQNFDNTAALAGRTLRLNGVGLRGVAWIKAFVAGLYLTAPSKDGNQILSMPGPKRLRLKIMLEAPSRELSKSLQSRASKEPEAVRQAMSARVNALSALIDGLNKVRPGDVLDLDYVPDVGVQLRYNDQNVGKPVEGEDLYRVVLKIFVGERPVDKRMKEGLLRGGY